MTLKKTALIQRENTFMLEWKGVGTETTTSEAGEARWDMSYDSPSHASKILGTQVNVHLMHKGRAGMRR